MATYINTLALLNKLFRKKDGGYNITYHVDKTPGNSGSKIMLVDEDLVKSNEKYGRLSKRYKREGKPHNLRKMIIGIHTGSDR